MINLFNQGNDRSFKIRFKNYDNREKQVTHDSCDYFHTCDTAAARVALETTGGNPMGPAPSTPPSRPKAAKWGAPGTERGSMAGPGGGSRSRLEDDDTSRVSGGGEMEEGRGGGGGGGGGPPCELSRRQDSVSI